MTFKPPQETPNTAGVPPQLLETTWRTWEEPVPDPLPAGIGFPIVSKDWLPQTQVQPPAHPSQSQSIRSTAWQFVQVAEQSAALEPFAIEITVVVIETQGELPNVVDHPVATHTLGHSTATVREAPTRSAKGTSVALIRWGSTIDLQ